MAEIQLTSKPYPHDEIKLSVKDSDLDIAKASALAKKKARAINKDAMLLSWHSDKTGDFWPKYHCGGGDQPPWIVFAEARGYNLLININDGQYKFYYLRL